MYYVYIYIYIYVSTYMYIWQRVAACAHQTQSMSVCQIIGWQTERPPAIGFAYLPNGAGV